MCGICGYINFNKGRSINEYVIKRMVKPLLHRGPDGSNHYCRDNLALGFSRLSIIDLEGGMQPLKNENDSMVMICNGEIFNYIELREKLKAKGHIFKTETDVEVLIHLYEDLGPEFLNLINGQFAFVIYDFSKQLLFCARDHFGVIPFHYTLRDGYFIFASEIKAILQHPSVKREVDLIGLDQIFSFPGLISPRTMFKHVKSLENGHYLLINSQGDIKNIEYWDLTYPKIDENQPNRDEVYYRDQLYELLTQSIKLRLRSDVPVGLYLSGGVDSSIIAAIANKSTSNKRRKSFSIDFTEKEISESKYQKQMAQFINSIHYDKIFSFSDISKRLPQAILHSECPLKETYNTASLALSELVNHQEIKVILSGEGADEIFAGYVGYRFDKLRQMQRNENKVGLLNEEKIRQKLWGDKNFFYEKNQFDFRKIKQNLYSDKINEAFDEIDCLNHFIINNEKLDQIDILHKRSYIDFKLRLVDHLVTDHGDRMALANSVEVRYPFLDKNLVEFAATIPSELKLKGFEEKYILKTMAKGLIPQEIVKREKFGFVAPGSPYLLKKDIEYINDLISYERIKKQGYFDPDSVEKLKKQYCQEDFKLNVPFDSDLMIIVITMGIFLEEFIDGVASHHLTF